MQETRSGYYVKSKNSWMKLSFLVLIWLLIWSLFRDFSKVRRGFLRVDEAQKRLTQVQIENRELQGKMLTVQTDYHKESVVRDKLNLQLPGETVVVMPERGDGGESENDKEIAKKENWQKWWEIVK